MNTLQIGQEFLAGKKNSRPAKKDSRPVKNSRQVKKNFSTGKKNTRPVKKFLDRSKKILDPREQISKDQYQFSKGGFASRLMERHLGLLSPKLDLKNNLDHFCPLWLSIVNLKSFQRAENLTCILKFACAYMISHGRPKLTTGTRT